MKRYILMILGVLFLGGILTCGAHLPPKEELAKTEAAALAAKEAEGSVQFRKEFQLAEEYLNLARLKNSLREYDEAQKLAEKSRKIFEDIEERALLSKVK